MGTREEERHGDENFSPIVSRESEMPDKTALENPTIPFRFHLRSETKERPTTATAFFDPRGTSLRSISLKIIGASAPGRSRSRRGRTLTDRDRPPVRHLCLSVMLCLVSDVEWSERGTSEGANPAVCCLSS